MCGERCGRGRRSRHVCEGGRRRLPRGAGALRGALSSGLALLTLAVSYGLALWQSLNTAIALVVFAAMAVLALFQILQPPLGPKRILLPASAVMAASLATALITT